MKRAEADSELPIAWIYQQLRRKLGPAQRLHPKFSGPHTQSRTGSDTCPPPHYNLFLDLIMDFGHLRACAKHNEDCTLVQHLIWSDGAGAMAAKNHI